MATDLETRKSTFKNEAYLEQKFAGLCARIRRVDVLACLLVLILTILAYALAMGWFDFFAGGGGAGWVSLFRWGGYGLFVGLTVILLGRLVRCAFRPINPYYVAHQLERTLPNPKNSLINWLDLHDEDLPTAFRKTLSASAAEHFEECDAEQAVRKRGNWMLLGGVGLASLGLLVLLLLGPAAFLASMLQAFAPWLDTERAARTRINLVQPESGNAEVEPTQPIRFTAKIEGRVPAANRPDGPRLLYRYQAGDDYLTQPLWSEGGGTWSALLQADQLRTGFFYKIAAGDAATPEYQVRLRTRAHVSTFAIAYLYRPFRNLAKTTRVFPNKEATMPSIRGPRGTEVEIVVNASRPVKQATVEIPAGNGMQALSPRVSADDPHVFACRFTLERSGKFRVLFTTAEGDENADRDAYDIEVLDDALPTVALTLPGKDVSLPANGTLELEGGAKSAVGVKSVALHMRVLLGPKIELKPMPYRPDISLQFDDGTYPDTIDYADVVALNELPKHTGGTHEFAAGTVLEYWLEATDAADYPNPGGNIGKSAVFKITLLAATKDVKKQQDDLKKARQKKQKRAHDQDRQHATENKQHKKDQGGSGSQGPSDPQDDPKKDVDGPKEQIKKALQDQDKDKETGGAKGPEQGQGEQKPGPQGSPDAPEPKNKDQKAEENAGNAKDPADGSGASGQAKDDGAKDKSEGEKKEPGAGKGIDQEGPGTANKDQDTKMDPMSGPAVKAKPGKEAGDSAGDAKQTPPDQTGDAGKARNDEPEPGKKESALDALGKLIEQFPSDAAGKALADIAKNAKDEAIRDFAKEVLEKNGRDPNTGKPLETKLPAKSPKTGTETKEGKNPAGTNGPSAGIGDTAKAAVANREFQRRLGQMQLDDWKKRMTPELLQKAGMSPADWQRFLKNMQTYDAHVRRLNAKVARETEMRGLPQALGTGVRRVEGDATSNGALERFLDAPPDLRDAQRRFTTPPNGP